MAEPDEIAAAALFLASDDISYVDNSSYVNDTELSADGGAGQV